MPDCMRTIHLYTTAGGDHIIIPLDPARSRSPYPVTREFVLFIWQHPDWNPPINMTKALREKTIYRYPFQTGD